MKLPSPSIELCALHAQDTWKLRGQDFRLNAARLAVFGQELKATREAHGLTQAALCRLVGVGRNTIYRLENNHNGEHRPHPETHFRLAQFLRRSQL